jgi:hypothetical protein
MGANSSSKRIASLNGDKRLFKGTSFSSRCASFYLRGPDSLLGDQLLFKGASLSSRGYKRYFSFVYGVTDVTLGINLDVMSNTLRYVTVQVCPE